MINYFNKATKTLSNFFKYEEELVNPIKNNIEDNLIYLNSQLILWKHDDNYEDDLYNKLFSFRFNNKFLIYNLIPGRKVEFQTNLDKLLDFIAPDSPSYTLEFLLTFAISAKNWLSLDSYNVLIVHDDLKNAKVLSLLCTMLSYLNKNTLHPMDLYANIISVSNLDVINYIYFLD
jgi:hypothetical protein